VLPGVVGCLQAMEVFKLVLGKGEPLAGTLLVYDALGSKFRRLKVGRDPQCAICGTAPTIKELIDYEEFCRSADE